MRRELDDRGLHGDGPARIDDRRTDPLRTEPLGDVESEFGERAEFVAIPFWPLAALAATSALLAAVVEVVRLAQKGGR